MSKREQSSKYYSAFFSKPGQQLIVPRDGSSRTAVFPALDADKFKKPTEFFKSSQSQSKDGPSNASRPLFTKRSTPGFSGNSHSSLSYKFQNEKPPRPIVSGPSLNIAQVKDTIVPKPQPGLPIKSMINFDANFASNKALQIQWERRMRLAKKAKLEAQRSVGGVETKLLLRNENTSKSPLTKSLWADVPTAASCGNSVSLQKKDPWYSESDDVWGDELPEEQVEEVLKIASTQETKKEHLFDWMDKEFSSPLEAEVSSKGSLRGCRTKLITSPKHAGPDIVALLDDSTFPSFVEEIESQAVKDSSASRSTNNTFPVSEKKTVGTRAAAPQNISPRSKFQATHSFPPLLKTPTTLSNPSTGHQNSFRPSKLEVPPSQEILSQSQRKLHQRSHSTEWLRGQLEIVNSKCSHLKEDVLIKEGESKLLREKLKSAEEEVKKHKLEKAKEIESVRAAYEKTLKETKKQLEAVRIQAMFKEKEVESSLDKYRELKNLFAVTPERPSTGQNNFKKFQNINSRPGESTAKILCEETTIFEDDADLLDLTPMPSSLKQSSAEKVISESPAKLPLSDKNPSIVILSSDQTTRDVLSFKNLRNYGKFYACPQDIMLFKSGYILQNFSIIKAAKQIVLGVQPQNELNHFLMPSIKYLPHMLRHTEFSEHDFENYFIRRPTLVQLWNTTYDAFGETLLNNYEKAGVGDVVQPDPAFEILSKSRYFTNLQPIHDCILTLADQTTWGPSKRAINKKLVETATLMARQLYAALCDPRILQTTYTIYDRDPKIIKELKSCPKHIDDFDPLSAERWKDELYIELRRCLVFIGYLCSAHHMTARTIVNPKSLNCGTTNEFFPPEADGSVKLLKRKNGEEVAFKIMLEESTRKSSEMELASSYRDHHSKKSTLVSLMSVRLNFDVSELRPPPMVEPSWVSEGISVEAMASSVSMEKLFEFAFKSFEKTELRSVEVACTSSNKPDSAFNLEELKCCLQLMDITLKVKDSSEFVRLIQNDLNPRKISSLKNLIDKQKKRGEVKEAAVHIIIPRSYEDALNSNILKVDLVDNMVVFCTPIDRCISKFEKQMMSLMLERMEHLQMRVLNSSKFETSKDLDLSRFVPLSPGTTTTRKRKSSTDLVERKKSKKYYIDFKTPQFDTELYSQIQTVVASAQDSQSNNAEDVIIDLVSSNEDDQLVKFEKRQEMEELRKKILAEEGEFEYKQPSLRKHCLAPFKIPCQDSPPQCDEPDLEIMEIEKMFATQRVPDALEASTWLSDSEDDPNDPDGPTVVSPENEVEIEFIPEVVGKFHNKLNKAALLELLSEIFKEGGVLRFTHHLNGLMLGTLLMLQNIVVYQKRETFPYIVKISTIVREILYTRPSPKILLEVNVLLSSAVVLPGFIKMLCHNADPETCVTRPNQVYFKRGACLLEVLCILVTYSVNDNSDDRICAEMSHWVHRIVYSQREHMIFLYGRDFFEPRQCKCIHALTNTIVMIYYRSLSQYRRSVGICSNDVARQTVLKNIVIHGIKVLWIMYSHGPITFLDRIQPEYQQYRELLNCLYTMHHDTMAYYTFQLSDADLTIVSELLKNDYDPNPPVSIQREHQSIPNLRNCSWTSPWGQALDNWSSILYTSDSEED